MHQITLPSEKSIFSNQENMCHNCISDDFTYILFQFLLGGGAAGGVPRCRGKAADIEKVRLHAPAQSLRTLLIRDMQ